MTLGGGGGVEEGPPKKSKIIKRPQCLNSSLGWLLQVPTSAGNEHKGPPHTEISVNTESQSLMDWIWQVASSQASFLLASINEMIFSS